MANDWTETSTGATGVLLVVDDRPESLRAVEASLRRKYGERYLLLQAASGAQALKQLDDVKQRGLALALLMVQQQLGDLSAVRLLQRGKELFPHVKRILYTADDAAAAQTTVDSRDQQNSDSYLLQPWEEPETCLYPVLADLIKDWEAAAHSPYVGLRIIGDRWSPQTHEAKDFLARNRVPYRWLDIEQNHEARQLLEQLALSDRRLPVIVFPDGSYLVDPPEEEIAARIGFSTTAEQPFYDLIIIGGGPAGLAAAVYGASEGLRTIIIEREAPGGQAGMSAAIENYLGFPEGLSGADLARRAVEQARRFSVEILAAREATALRAHGEYRVVTLDNGSELWCYAVLIATGIAYRTLAVPGADQLSGAGVYYGAASAEALACEGQDVCLLGGGNSAGQAALHIAGFARSVTIVTMEESLDETMSQYLINRIADLEHIHVRPHATIAEIHGDQRVEAVSIKDLQTEQVETIPTTAVFVWIGGTPHTDWLEGAVKRDERGFILAGPDLLQDGQPPRDWPLKRTPYLLETSIPGVFVAGDVRASSVKRIAAAVGEGSMAIQFIHQYLLRK